MYFAGIDPSYNGTGVVVLDHAFKVHVARSVVCPAYDGNQQQRRQIISTLACTWLESLEESPRMVVLEAPHVGPSGRVSIMLGALYGCMLDALFRRGWPVIVVQPSEVKKFATGGGAAKKDEMRLAVFKRWQFEHRSNDIVDAYAMARLAGTLLGIGSDTSEQAKLADTIRRRLPVPL